MAECQTQCFPFCSTASEKRRIQSCLGTFLPQAASKPFIQPQEKNGIDTSGRWKSYIHLSMGEEMLTHFTLAALTAHLQIAEAEGPCSREWILGLRGYSSEKAKIGALNWLFCCIDYVWLNLKSAPSLLLCLLFHPSFYLQREKESFYCIKIIASLKITTPKRIFVCYI